MIVEHALSFVVAILILHAPLLLFTLITYLIAAIKVIRRRRAGTLPIDWYV